MRGIRPMIGRPGLPQPSAKASWRPSTWGWEFASSALACPSGHAHGHASVDATAAIESRGASTTRRRDAPSGFHNERPADRPARALVRWDYTCCLLLPAPRISTRALRPHCVQLLLRAGRRGTYVDTAKVAGETSVCRLSCAATCGVPTTDRCELSFAPPSEPEEDNRRPLLHTAGLYVYAVRIAAYVRRGGPPVGAPGGSWHVAGLERKARRCHVQEALLVAKCPAGQSCGAARRHSFEHLDASATAWPFRHGARR